MKVLGKPRRRVDGRAKVTGQTRFADDIVLPRMLHMKLLRSPHPHALIEEMNVEKAKSHPGVHLVLTGKDFPITFGILPVTQDEYPLAPQHVRYVGDPVAAVVARDEQTATEALDLIEVKYKPLKTISDPVEALQNPEPRIHAYSEQGNIHRLQAFEFGDVEESFRKSDHVFEDLFFYEGNTHLPIEQHASVAALDGEGKITLWSSTQVPHYVHKALSRVLQIPAAHVRVIATPNGGGFGGKCDVCNHEMVVAQGGDAARPAGEDLPQPRGSVLHAPWPAPGADADAHRRDEGRQAHRHARADAGRRRRLRLLRRGEHLLHRRAADGDLRAAALQVRRGARLHQQAALRPQARPRHAAAALRPGSAARQDRREARRRPGGAAPAERRQGKFPHRQLAAGRLDRPCRMHPAGGGTIAAGRSASGSSGLDKAWASPAARTSAAPGCRSTGTRCRRAACSSSSTAAAR